jgi:hypothetical protein
LSRFGGDGIDPPTAHAFELVLAVVFELDPGAETRSRTVSETSTSPGPASAETRAPV